MSEDLKPEVGDTVEWGQPVYSAPANLPRRLICDARRGKIIRAYKNGNATVQPDNGGSPEKVYLNQFTILSKAE